MGRQAPWTIMVPFLCCIYSLIGQSPAVSSVSVTGYQYHSLLVVRCAIIPKIRMAARWWKPSSYFSMATVTTQISHTGYYGYQYSTHWNGISRFLCARYNISPPQPLKEMWWLLVNLFCASCTQLKQWRSFNCTSQWDTRQYHTSL